MRGRGDREEREEEGGVAVRRYERVSGWGTVRGGARDVGRGMRGEEGAGGEGEREREEREVGKE